MEHENIHTIQQKHSNIYAVWWWVKYILSRKFRYSQELEAYTVQYRFIVEHYSYSHWKEFLTKICKDLSGSLYGNIVTYEEARKAIRLAVHGYE